jgi:NAD(P)-dependent dehydrogenase (short-subunit alcohol dehydrogenase family)
MNIDGLLQGKVVLITGGASGQGRAHAVVSAEHGADVVLLDVRDPLDEEFVETQKQVRACGQEVLPLSVDVTSQGALDEAVRAAVKRFGHIDAVVANAGIWLGGDKFWETDEDLWDRVFEINLKGVWKTLKAVAPHMVQRGEGSVVIISSVDAFDAEDDSTPYGVSKAAVLGFAKYAAYELGAYGVRCNTIAPGFVDTAMVNSQQWYDMLAGAEGAGTRQHLIDYADSFHHLAGTALLDPRDIADTALYLNSHLARNVTGAVVAVDAGHLLVHRGR